MTDLNAVNVLQLAEDRVNFSMTAAVPLKIIFSKRCCQLTAWLLESQYCREFLRDIQLHRSLFQNNIAVNFVGKFR